MATKPAPKPAATPESEDVLMMAFYKQNPKARAELEEHCRGSVARVEALLGHKLPIATLPPEAAPPPPPPKPTAPAWSAGLGPHGAPRPWKEVQAVDWGWKPGQPGKEVKGIAEPSRPPTAAAVAAAHEAHRKSQPRFGPGTPPPIVPDVPAAAEQAVPVMAFAEGRFPTVGRAPVDPKSIVANNPDLVLVPGVVRDVVLIDLGYTGSAAVAAMNQLKGWVGTPGMTRAKLVELARAGKGA